MWDNFCPLDGVDLFNSGDFVDSVSNTGSGTTHRIESQSWLAGLRARDGELPRAWMFVVQQQTRLVSS
jgi:hypothetical protein